MLFEGLVAQFASNVCLFNSLIQSSPPLIIKTAVSWLYICKSLRAFFRLRAIIVFLAVTVCGPSGNGYLPFKCVETTTIFPYYFHRYLNFATFGRCRFLLLNTCISASNFWQHISVVGLLLNSSVPSTCRFS